MKDLFLGAGYSLACFLFIWMLFSIWTPLPYVVLVTVAFVCYVIFLKTMAQMIMRGETPNVRFF